jgi:hypothetical protein
MLRDTKLCLRMYQKFYKYYLYVISINFINIIMRIVLVIFSNFRPAPFGIYKASWEPLMSFWCHVHILEVNNRWNCTRMFRQECPATGQVWCLMNGRFLWENSIQSISPSGTRLGRSTDELWKLWVFRNSSRRTVVATTACQWGLLLLVIEKTNKQDPYLLLVCRRHVKRRNVVVICNKGPRCLVYDSQYLFSSVLWQIWKWQIFLWIKA